jgi:hypothetical protein
MILKDLIDALQRAEEANDLLLRLWLQIDVYSGELREGKLDVHTLNELLHFFNFDDSE